MKNDTLFIIEDDISLCDILDIMLRNYNYDFHIYQHGNNIVEDIIRHQPNLILTDYLGVNGGEICKRIKVNYPELPVLLFSACSEPAKVAEKFHFDGFIEKPFELDDLLFTIDKYSRQQEA